MRNNELENEQKVKESSRTWRAMYEGDNKRRIVSSCQERERIVLKNDNDRIRFLSSFTLRNLIFPITKLNAAVL